MKKEKLLKKYIEENICEYSRLDEADIYRVEQTLGFQSFVLGEALKNLKNEILKTITFNNKMKFETLIYILLVIAGSVLIASGFKDSLGKSFERRDKGMCEVWKTEAELYPNYFITGWQKSQCDSYDIDIDTFVVN